MTTAQREAGLPVARCPGCELVVYPATAGSCPRCATAPLDPDVVDGDGVIWSWTVQRYAPKSPPYVPPPSGFAPFVVAYVQTADGFRVEGVIAAEGADAVTIGQRVRLVSIDDDVPRYRLVDEGKDPQ